MVHDTLGNHTNCIKLEWTVDIVREYYAGHRITAAPRVTLCAVGSRHPNCVLYAGQYANTRFVSEHG